ncbi:ubiquitin carboxyl-terminal hydrolase 35-like [Saccostrea cucullata]|uniref:ubiquitin carboxyl-terminal hydrolase 35-like n=1 Tax=Saccostrea cuccullata TaxID=36930 RepID=UPI002ED080CC
MDAILNGILTSQHSDSLKKKLITKVTENSSKPQPVHVIRSVLQISSSWFLQGESDIAVSEGLQVYISWAKYNLKTFEAFFDREFLLSLFSYRGKQEANAVLLLEASMELLQRSSSYSGHVKVVEAKAISYVREHPSIDCLTNFVNFLSKFRECLPKGDFVSTFCVSLIHSLSMCSIPQDHTEIFKYIKNVDRICFLIHDIWNNADSDVIMDSLKAIFGIISAIEETEPSFCLGAVVRNIPEKMIEVIVKYAIGSNVDNTRMTTALQRVVDWLQWPTATNVHMWIITFFRSLAGAKKYSILITVTETKVEQVCQKLEFSAVREGALSVLTHMLLGFQHSPEPFHKILPQMVKIIEILTKENTTMLKQLSDLLHCCFFLHAGYPDLYDPILEALKGIAPSSEEIKSRLEESHWQVQQSGTSKYVSKVTQRSETGKTGLFNLGNTCFMNSILQALFMCDSFRRDTLSYQASPDQPVISQLQQVFAFLSQTQRPAYAPMTFSRMTRPSWFVAGHQQDCSEYLRYLLDQIHEQERTRQKKEKLAKELADSENQATEETATDTDSCDKKSVITSLIEDHFGGIMVTTVTCLNCKTQSSRKEEFSDIPLAFPEYKPIITQESGDKTKPETEPKTQCLHLNDLLQYYLKPERLTGDNQYFCDKCESLQDGERRISIVQPPEHLIVTLLRFSYDPKIHARSKIFQEVKYPRTLILPKNQATETKNANSRRSLRSAVSRQIEKCGVDLNTQKGEVYGLNAVVVHSGTSSESGHYYAYSRHSLFQDPESVMTTLSDCTDEDGIDFLQDKWYLFNDNRVSYAQYNSFCSVTQRFTKDTAYLLFYKRIDPQNSENGGVDLNKSIRPSEVDPPLQDKLRQLVSKDNALYLQEQEVSEQKRASRKRPVSQTSSWFYKQDEDQGPPGSCGGSSGFDSSGPRFVF